MKNTGICPKCDSINSVRIPGQTGAVGIGTHFYRFSYSYFGWMYQDITHVLNVDSWRNGLLIKKT